MGFCIIHCMYTDEAREMAKLGDLPILKICRRHFCGSQRWFRSVAFIFGEDKVGIIIFVTITGLESFIDH